MQSSSKIRQMTVFEIAWYCIRARFGAPHRTPCLVSQPSEWVDPSIAPQPVNRKHSPTRAGMGFGSGGSMVGCLDKEKENLLRMYSGEGQILRARQDAGSG